MTKPISDKALRRHGLQRLAALMSLELPRDVLDSIREAHDRLSLPLADVLGKVPGDTVKARADYIGIARQTYYQWLRGVARPNPEQAEKLAKITGYSVEQIRGRTTHDTDQGSEHAAQASG